MDALEVAVRLARALGLAPYTAPTATACKRGKYTLNSTYRRVGLGVLLVLGVAVCSLMVLEIYLSRHSGHAVQDLTVKATLCVSVCMVCAFLVLLWWRQNPLLLKVLNSELFRSLPPLGIREAAAPLLIAAMHVCAVSVSVWSESVWKTNPAIPLILALERQVAKLLYIILVGIDIAVFAFLLTCVAVHVDGMNDSLKEMAARARNEHMMALAEADVIATLRRKHQQAVLTTERLCSAFGWLVFLCFCVDLGWFVENSFLLVSYAGRTQSLVLVLLMGIAKAVVFSAIISTLAHQLATQTNRTTLSLLHVIRNSSCRMNTELRRELNAFSSQISQLPLVVSLGGVVELNLPFFFQAFGAAAMFVVVLVQFHQSIG